MLKRFLLTGLFLLTLLGAIFGTWGWNLYKTMQKFAKFTPPPISVSLTTARSESWRDSLSAVGTLEATRGVDLSSEAQGIVTNKPVKSGRFVKAGQVILELNDAIDQAELKHRKAELKLADLDYHRQKNLVKQRAAANSDLDKASARRQQAQAQLEIAIAKVEQKHIKAPFSGKLGIFKVHLGQYVSPSTAIVSLQALDPLYVRFSVPEQYLPVLNDDQPIDLAVATNQSQRFSGKITAIDSHVDPQTHNITALGKVPNPKHELYPGLFAKITIHMPKAREVVSIPKIAVTYSLHGDSVFVIEKDKGHDVAKRRYITLGREHHNRVAVIKGLKVGERVVAAGHNKLQDQSRIVVDTETKLDKS